MSGRLLKIGCRGVDVDVCVLKVLLKIGPLQRFAPVGRDDFNMRTRGDIVDLVNTKTGLKLATDDNEVMLAINRSCVKLMKKGLINRDKFVSNKVFDKDATIWNLFWIDGEKARRLVRYDGHMLVKLPSLGDKEPAPYADW